MDSVKEQKITDNQQGDMNSSGNSDLGQHQIQWAIQNDIKDLYTFNEELGLGSFGKVISVENLKLKQHFACKEIPKKKIQNIEQYSQDLLKIKKMEHPNIIKIFEVYDSKETVYIVMEKCEGDDIIKYLLKNKNQIHEAQTTKIMRQILQAILYMHERKICHGDIKLENFLLKYKNDDASIKVLNYGLYTHFNKEIGIQRKIERLKGAPFYQSPEIINDYDLSPQQDMWSLGVVVYFLISGKSPFQGQDSKCIYENIKKGIFSFNPQPFKKCSFEVKDLISKLLLKNPQKRYNSYLAYNHPWVQQNINNDDLEKLLHDEVFTGLEQLIGSKNDQKRAMLLFMVSQIPEKKKRALKKIYDKIDEDGSGSVTEDELVEGMGKFGPSAGVNMNEDQIRKVFKQMDYDGGGSIDFEEFMASFVDNQSSRSEDFLIEQFKKMDKDGSGSIGRQELMELLKVLPLGDVDLEEMVDECDKDGDGEINFDEFISLLRDKTK